MTGTTKPNNDRDRRCDRDAAPDHGLLVEVWAERHRMLGHHPRPAPTTENPERWECKCDPDAKGTAVWRILTAEQIFQKFAHVNHRMRTP